MKKRVPDKFWFPWWPDKWIFGSVRIEYTPAERGMWVDMLSLASKDDGHIRANEETPYPIKQLAGMLIIPEDELKAAIEKFIETKKIERDKFGCLYVSKWEKYQFSDRHKRRMEGAMSDNPDTMSKEEDAYSILNNNTVNDNRIEDITLTEKEILKELKKVKNYPYDFIRTINYIRELSVEFPFIDTLEEIKNKVTWWLDHPLKKGHNPHLQIRNWFKNAVKFQAQDKQGKQVGSQQPKSEYTNEEKLLIPGLKKEYQQKLNEAAKEYGWETEEDIDPFKIRPEYEYIKEKIIEMRQK